MATPDASIRLSLQTRGGAERHPCLAGGRNLPGEQSGRASARTGPHDKSNPTEDASCPRTGETMRRRNRGTMTVYRRGEPGPQCPSAIVCPQIRSSKFFHPQQCWRSMRPGAWGRGQRYHDAGFLLKVRAHGPRTSGGSCSIITEHSTGF